jgi:uncharacterized membrane protein
MKYVGIFALALSVAGWAVEANAETLKAEIGVHRCPFVVKTLCAFAPLR